MKSRDCKQIWRALRPAISVVFEILVKKLRIEDTEAYQEMMRMHYETLCEILTAGLVILPTSTSVLASFWQYADRETIIRSFKQQFQHVQTT